MGFLVTGLGLERPSSPVASRVRSWGKFFRLHNDLTCILSMFLVGPAFLPSRIVGAQSGVPPAPSLLRARGDQPGVRFDLCERDSQTCACWKETASQARMWKSPGVGFIPDLVPGGDGWGFTPRYSP